MTILGQLMAAMHTGEGSHCGSPDTCYCCNSYSSWMIAAKHGSSSLPSCSSCRRRHPCGSALQHLYHKVSRNVLSHTQACTQLAERACMGKPGHNNMHRTSSWFSGTADRPAVLPCTCNTFQKVSAYNQEPSSAKGSKRPVQIGAVNTDAQLRQKAFLACPNKRHDKHLHQHWPPGCRHEVHSLLQRCVGQLLSWRWLWRRASVYPACRPQTLWTCLQTCWA